MPPSEICSVDVARFPHRFVELICRVLYVQLIIVCNSLLRSKVRSIRIQLTHENENVRFFDIRVINTWSETRNAYRFVCILSHDFQLDSATTSHHVGRFRRLICGRVVERQVLHCGGHGGWSLVVDGG